jgi:hypothetical protein
MATLVHAQVAEMTKPKSLILPGEVCCPSCTHEVEAQVTLSRRSAATLSGQKCPRCGSPLDAAPVTFVERAA